MAVTTAFAVPAGPLMMPIGTIPDGLADLECGYLVQPVEVRLMIRDGRVGGMRLLLFCQSRHVVGCTCLLSSNEVHVI